VEALEEIADNYVSLDDYKKAEKACYHALKLDEESYTAKYILGFIHSQKQEWKTAVDYLKSSNSIHSNNPEILRCLGWALFNSNKHTQGLVILERALNLDPENALTLCDLGICYMQKENFEKSIELLKRAMRLDPDNPRIKDCLKAASSFQEKVKSFKKS
jgi:anaphase-promoting complex subunit 3